MLLFSFRQIQVYLEEVAEKHNDWVQLSVEGWTQEGRPLYLLQLGKLEEGASTDRRYVYIDAGMLLQITYQAVVLNSNCT